VNTNTDYTESRFETIWAALTIGVCILFSPLLRRWYNRWGATESEYYRPLPGDERVRHPRQVYTRAISIAATPAQVWPWLVQMGQGRGGLYSYERLENLIGCDIHNADRILDAYQELRVGDVVRLGPPGYPLYKVVEVQPRRALVMAGADPKTEQVPDISQPFPATYVNNTWLLWLDEHPDGSTRLLVRSRMEYNDSFANGLMWRLLVEPMNFVMERQMLRGIQARAEAEGGRQQAYARQGVREAGR
jgi:hypothetical protein